MNKLMNRVDTVVAKLKADDKRGFKFGTGDEVDQGVELINDLVNKYDADIYDIEPDGLNMIKDRTGLLYELWSAVKNNYDDPEDIAGSPELYDMVKIGNDDLDEYFYVNGYARVECLTVNNLLCEINDVLDYLKDKF